MSLLSQIALLFTFLVVGGWLAIQVGIVWCVSNDALVGEGKRGGMKMLRGNVLSSEQLFVCGGEGAVLHCAPRPHTQRYRRRAQYKETREVTREIEELSVEKSNAKHY
jgi:hypothetical protein